MSLEPTEHEVRIFENNTAGADDFAGVVRKLLGLSFLGETRTGEHWVIADVKIKGIDIDTDVSFSYVSSSCKLNLC